MKSVFQGKSLLLAVLALCIARLWLMPLSSSLWVDEMATVFVVQHGGSHPSLAVAPQVPASIYYVLPGLVERWFGFSEVGYRLPSVLAMLAALFFVAKVAQRLLHPDAGWLAVFCCLALGGIDYHAADARPYALGIAVGAATLWCLVRWLDSGHWRDALFFIACGSLVWRVHLINWPFYLAIALYAGVRLWRQESRVGWGGAVVVFGLLGLALVPVLLRVLALIRQAQEHVIVEEPSFRVFFNSLQLRLLVICGLGAKFLMWVLKRPALQNRVPVTSLVLITAWWLSQPVCLYVFSLASGNSVFVQRYLSVALPGAALAATALVAHYLPKDFWKPVALLLGVGVLLVRAQWTTLWPQHDNSNWRAAAQVVNSLQLGPDVPLICPSPFVEAKWPVWHPDYPLPAFLYAHLPVYPIAGRPYLFPNGISPEGERYATELLAGRLSESGKFVLYGGAGNVRYWRKWFEEHAAGWTSRSLGNFGDMGAILFESRVNP